MTAAPTPYRIGRALLTLVAWIGVTLVTGALLRSGSPGSLPEIVNLLSSSVVWNVLAGIAVLALATRAWGWRDLGFGRPDFWAVARLSWFPILTLSPFYAIAFAIGLPPDRALVFLAVNTTLIALSEEWMFRGILFRALHSHLRLWPAIALASALFGAIHVLNAFAFGDVSLAAVQAVAAAMTGVLLVALMLRTGSIWPSVIYHMVWNFGVLLVAYETANYPQPEGPLPLSAYTLPMLIVLPNFLFGLILLRKLPNVPMQKAFGNEPDEGLASRQ